ncbi:DUF6257 family protein [Streptomyces sp. NBC_01622]|uniref:DUF6257 family protein n=1 Tax=Streptomyces sp. NBC_01622 TaxID=2975903 RepID=UPI0038641C63|nr:DUF6257 family protein [Streptomyces sp. NBC_01622]
MAKPDDFRFKDFTGTEKARIVLLAARMGWRGMAGPEVDISDLKRKAERIEKNAERRKNKQ